MLCEYIHVCVCVCVCIIYAQTGFLYTYELSGGSDSKESTCNAGDLGSIHGLERSPREGHGYPLQYSGLENPADTGAWWVTVHGVAESQAQLRDFHYGHHFMCKDIYNIYPCNMQKQYFYIFIIRFI